jgi:UDP-N-acetyl-2-amino-2-deoxyglucuronate dehydrogenase
MSDPPPGRPDEEFREDDGMPFNFALIGTAGYIAPRHMAAIRATGNRLVAAADPHDSVGILDQFDFGVRFFTEIERFDRHLEKLRRGPEPDRVHFVSICSPNYLHDAHCRLALRIGADAICEKPLVINPWNLDPLRELEEETGKRVYNLLQLRTHPTVLKLRSDLADASAQPRHDVVLTYITSRGSWYHTSWKGSEEKSGGVAMNIGVHFFDMLLWLFGRAGDVRVYHSDRKRLCGFLDLERASVRWFLSVDPLDLPANVRAAKRSTFRSITVDGKEVDFTEGFTDLHTKVYEEILAGRGFGIEDARPSIELVHRIRHAALSAHDEMLHPHFSGQIARYAQGV